MKGIKTFFLFVFIAAGIISCGEPEPEKQTVSVSVRTVEFSDAGGSYIVLVTANGNWYAEASEKWVSLSASAGSGNASLEIRVPANEGEARSATVQVKSKDETAGINISQAAYVKKTVSIKEVRSYYKGSDYKITEDIYVTGVVISDYRRSTDGGLNNYSSAKTIIISDGEAGLMLYCTSDNKNIARGDRISVSLLGQTLSVYNNGPVQVNGLSLSNIEVTGSGEEIQPREISMEELLSGEYESTYVAVKDVEVADEYVGRTFVIDSKNTSIPFWDETGASFDLFTSQYAIFAGEAVPVGSGTLRGIAGKYGSRIQMSVSSRSDYAGLTAPRFSIGVRFSLSFNEYPCSGDEGSFSVTLNSDIEWTASCSSPDVSVSPDSGSGTAVIEISYGKNPSTSEPRTSVITFHPVGNELLKDQTLSIVQQPYELLNPSEVRPWLEMPAVPASDKQAFFSHDMKYQGATVRNYSFLLDLENKLSLWVAYPLYKGMTNGVGRTDKWAFDPLVPRRYQHDASRSYSGYDRGHQLPSADRLCTTEANEATFYYTNITPQNPDLNSGVWETLERKLRDQLSSCDTLYVVTGCLLGEGSEAKFVKDAQGRDVAVPTHYYKAALKYKAGDANGGYSAIAFLFENKAYGNISVNKSFAMTVDEIEKLTGQDFFVNLNSGYQAEAEAKFDPSAWGL